MYDVVIVGGGPAGLAAALTLGRARVRALLCDAGPARNAAAAQLHNFVTRDGTPPETFRRIGRGQLAIYPSIEIRDARVERIHGEKGAFRVRIDGVEVTARRVLLCTGMIDVLPDIEGLADLWGRSVFQCPFCHGWEVRDQVWGYVMTHAEGLRFPPMMRQWTKDAVVFADPAVGLTAAQIDAYESDGITVHVGRVARLIAGEGTLSAVELDDGRRVTCAALYAHPPQRQVPMVAELGLALDEQGYVQADPMTRETSIPGIHAAGDLTTRMQSAIGGSADGMQAAAMLTHGFALGR